MVADVAGVGFMDAVHLVPDRVGWGALITASVTGIDRVFLAIGAFAAYGLVARQRPTARQRLTARQR